MSGGLTYKDMDRRKIAERNLDEALEWMRGRCTEELITLERIMRRDLPEKP